MDEVDILAVGAHPDDVEIACGGTLIKQVKAGSRVHIVDLTNGEPTPRGTPETRLAEARAAAETLGAGRTTLDWPNRYLEDKPAVRRDLAVLIRRLRPRVLLAPYPGGDHPDHRAAAAIARGARFYGKLTKTDYEGRPWPGEPWWVPRFYWFSLGVFREGRHPDFIVDVSEEREQKLAVLANYKSQFPIERFQDRGNPFGPMIGVKQGEAFYCPTPLAVKNLLDLG